MALFSIEAAFVLALLTVCHRLYRRLVTGQGWNLGPGEIVHQNGTFLAGSTRSESERIRSDVRRWKHDTYGLVDRYGKIYRTYNGPNSTDVEIALADPEYIAEFYREDGREHGKETGMGFGDYFTRLYGQSLGIYQGEDWSRMKKIFAPQFTVQAVRDSSEVIKNEIGRWVDNLALEHHASSKSSYEVGAVIAVAELPLKVISLVLYSEVLEPSDFKEETSLIPLHGRIVETAISDTSARSQWLRWYLRDQRNADLKQWFAKWAAFNARMVKKTREKGISSMVEGTFQSVESGEISASEWLQTLDEILLTNIDVTSGVMAWNLAMCAVFPQMQEKLYAEIEEHGRGDPETYLASGTSYIHNFAVEVSRLRPAFAYSLPEATAKDKIIGGYHIPAGTSVIIDGWGLNTSAPAFESDPKVFRPERYDDEKPQSVRQQYWRFGLGPRRCLGQLYAERAIKLVLIEFLSRYRIELGESHQAERTAWAQDVTRIPIDPARHISSPAVTLKMVNRLEPELS